MGSGGTQNENGRRTTTQLDGTSDNLHEGEGGSEEPDFLRIRLSRVDPSVHQKTAVGSSVTVDGKAVRVDTGILGYIPDNDYQSVRERGFTSGEVVDLPDGKNPSAIVIFTE